MGGRQVAVERLNELFDGAREDALDDIIGIPEEWYWHGNEIDLHVPFLFALAGRPELTRSAVAWVLDTWYSTGADGLAGNDDGGTLSAWAVWAMIGVYPMAGTDGYVLSWPVFDKVELDREDGSTLTITRSGDGLAEDAEVSILIDGEPWTEPLLDHQLWSTASTVTFQAR
jgi:putative alpha-1,2-mannosidase